MGWLSSLFGGGTGSAVDAIGSAFDKLFTSDEERAQAEAVLEKIKQQPQVMQVELNKIEAQHRSIVVAGWRPAIGWVVACGLFFSYVVNPVLSWYTGRTGPEIPIDAINEMAWALLGIYGSQRTFEKIKGRAK